MQRVCKTAAENRGWSLTIGRGSLSARGAGRCPFNRNLEANFGSTTRKTSGARSKTPSSSNCREGRGVGGGMAQRCCCEKEREDAPEAGGEGVEAIVKYSSGGPKTAWSQFEMIDSKTKMVYYCGDYQSQSRYRAPLCILLGALHFCWNPVRGTVPHQNILAPDMEPDTYRTTL